MAIYAQILSAIFALMAAALWLGAAFVRTPRSFSVQVTWTGLKPQVGDTEQAMS